MAETLQLPKAKFDAVKEAQSKMGVLPLSAREDDKHPTKPLTPEKIASMDAGRIKSLLYAGGGEIFPQYRCTADAKKSGNIISYLDTKSNTQKELAVPTWVGIGEAFILSEVTI